MSSTRIRKTGEKQQAIYEAYCTLLKSYGTNAAYMKTKVIYDEIAENFFVEPNYVRKVVREKIKNIK